MACGDRSAINAVALSKATVCTRDDGFFLYAGLLTCQRVWAALSEHSIPSLRDSSAMGRGLPRSLLDIERAAGYQSSASANPNPDLQCQGCPTTDTRAQVTDTTAAPWTAIGLLAREEQMALSA